MSAIPRRYPDTGSVFGGCRWCGEPFTNGQQYGASVFGPVHVDACQRAANGGTAYEAPWKCGRCGIPLAHPSQGHHCATRINQ